MTKEFLLHNDRKEKNENAYLQKQSMAAHPCKVQDSAIQCFSLLCANFVYTVTIIIINFIILNIVKNNYI